MLAAANPADSQVKDEKPRAPFDQWVKFEKVDPDTGKTVYTEGKVPAYRPATKAPMWRLDRNAIKTDNPIKAAVITDKYGKVYKISKFMSSGAGQLWCPIDEPEAK